MFARSCRKPDHPFPNCWSTIPPSQNPAVQKGPWVDLGEPGTMLVLLPAPWVPIAIITGELASSLFDVARRRQRLSRVPVALAWIYVATRAAHLAVHLGGNRVRHRFRLYLASWLALLTLWIDVAGVAAQHDPAK